VTKRVAIVGVGAFGARHLQALARIERPLRVDIVDPSEIAIGRAMGLLADAGGLKQGSVAVHANASTLDAAPDVTIVATTSRHRRAAIGALVARGARRLILEKVLFPRLDDYDAVATMLSESKADAWVNCARRAYPRARDLVALFGGRSLTYRVAGSGWGLASNLIHHLDEFAMLCGSADIAVTAADLRHAEAQSKRPGYLELFGHVRASAPDGSTFHAACMEGRAAMAGDRVVNIDADELRVTLRQAEQTMTIRQNGNARVEPWPVPLQSELTAAYVTAILEGGVPNLPDCATSAKLHRPMLAAFMEHQRRAAGVPSLEECLIT
jgi:predicted dehydrogenase